MDDDGKKLGHIGADERRSTENYRIEMLGFAAIPRRRRGCMAGGESQKITGAQMTEWEPGLQRTKTKQVDKGKMTTTRKQAAYN